MLTIGTNLRTLRLKKGVTQEQLAEALGLSPQAVSRWENDSSYPDITLLPGLADYYGVTVDELIGMKHIHKTENIRALHGRILDLSREGKLEEAEAAAREGLRTWPDDGGLLVALTEVLARRHDPTCAAEGLRIGARAMVHPDVSGKTRSTAAVNMIFLCMQLGEADRAAQIVRSLPHVWESREIVVPEIADDYPAALREAVRKVLVFLCRKIEAAEDRVPGEIPAYFQLGADFTPEKDDKDMLDVIAGFLAE